MPNIDIIKEIKIKDSFRVASMRGIYDVPINEKIRHEWHIEIPFENIEWNIGLIIGASGSGKTTIGKELFGKQAYHNAFKWDKNSIIDNFPKQMSTQSITNVLNHVGFSSPPSWVKPYQILSNGEKFRVELARILCGKKEIIVIDEFTSVIDRTVAKIGSHAIQKYIKKTKKKIVCLSCHKDIIDWLSPDWIYDLDIKKFHGRWLQQRPKIKLDIYKCKSNLWYLFKDYHYLSNNIAKSAVCYVALYQNIPVAFSSHISVMGVKKMYREHRTVTLPDYQGIGIGNILSNYIADLVKRKGYRYVSTTSHPAFIQSRLKSKKWILKRKSSMNNIDKKKRTSAGRLTCSLEYIG